MKRLFRVIGLFIMYWKQDVNLTKLKVENKERVRFLEDLICGKLPKETLESEVRAILYKREVENNKWKELIEIIKQQPITESKVKNE